MVEHIVNIQFNDIKEEDAPKFRYMLYKLFSENGFDTDLLQHTIIKDGELAYYANKTRR